ncbi:MAG: PilZ domain-containing protein [Candidatus Omnitrophota bacterium]
MSYNGFQDRRAFPRFAVAIRVALMDPSLCGQILGAKTQDISIGGLGIITENKLTPGLQLDIRLHMADNGQVINLKGRAVWITPMDSERYRVGIQLEGSLLKPIPLVLRILKSHQH